MMYPFMAHTPECHPHDFVRPSRLERIGDRGRALISDKCVSNALRILRVFFS